MNRTQRWIIVQDGKRIVGTDAGQAFTENAAHQKCALLQEAKPKATFKVEEITPFFRALT